MIVCAHCQSELEDDSFYCDQCSKEVFICTYCGKTGIGKRCIHDGKPLMSAQANATAKTSMTAPASVGIVTGLSAKSPASSRVQPPAIQQNKSAPVVTSTLTLINNTLNLRILIENDDIIGRNQGQHTAIFGQYNQVSGKHAQFTYDRLLNAWCVTDLNSTNHTKLGAAPIWESINPLEAHKPTSLQHGHYLLIARIEFIIQIAGDTPPSNETITQSGTLRIV